MSNDIHYKVRDEIIYPSPNFNGVAIKVWEWSVIPPHTLIGM